VKRFRGGLVFKAHRLLYHSTPALRVIKKRGITWLVAKVASAAAEVAHAFTFVQGVRV